MKYFIGSKYFLLKFPVLHRRNIKTKLWRFLQIFVAFLENLNFKNAPSIIILLHCVCRRFPIWQFPSRHNYRLFFLRLRSFKCKIQLSRYICSIREYMTEQPRHTTQWGILAFFSLIVTITLYHRNIRKHLFTCFTSIKMFMFRFVVSLETIIVTVFP